MDISERMDGTTISCLGVLGIPFFSYLANLAALVGVAWFVTRKKGGPMGADKINGTLLCCLTFKLGFDNGQVF